MLLPSLLRCPSLPCTCMYTLASNAAQRYMLMPCDAWYHYHAAAILKQTSWYRKRRFITFASSQTILFFLLYGYPRSGEGDSRYRVCRNLLDSEVEGSISLFFSLYLGPIANCEKWEINSYCRRKNTRHMRYDSCVFRFPPLTCTSLHDTGCCNLQQWVFALGDIHE